MDIRNFSRIDDLVPVPDLVQLQTRSYEDFAQSETAPRKRKNQGLESIFREMFPIKGYDGKLSLEYLSYDLGKARYTPDDCRRLRLTYGRPLRVKLRLVKDQLEMTHQ